MTTITTRSGKGSPLTNNEVDANFTNLNDDKAELSGADFTGIVSTTAHFSLGNTYNRVADKASGGAFGGGYNLYMDDGTPKHDSLGNLSGYYYTSGGQVRFYASPSSAADTVAIERLRIANNGDITFYDTDGTSASFFYDASSGLTINEAGADRDFRVESDSTTHALFVDAGNDRVGVGESAPEATLHVKSNSAGAFTASGASQLLLENNTTVRLTLISPNTNSTKIEFGDVDDQDAGAVDYSHFDDSMRFKVNGSDRLRISSAGAVAVGNFSPKWSYGLGIELSGDTSSGVGSLGTRNIASQNFQYYMGNNVENAGAFVDEYRINGFAVKYEQGSANGNHVFSVAPSGTAGDTISFRTPLTISQASLIVNEDSRDYDFRVESNESTHALFVDAGQSHVGINCIPSNAELHIKGNFESDYAIKFNNTQGDGSAEWGFRSHGINGERFAFYDVANNKQMMAFSDDGSGIVINEDSYDQDFRVESDSFTHMLFVDAGNDRVGINASSPENPLHVNDTSASSQILVQGDSNDASIKFNRSGQTFVIGIDATDNGFKISDDPTLGTTDRLRIASSGAATFTNSLEADSYGFTQNSSATGIQDAIFRSTTGRIEVRAGNVDDMLVIDGTNGVIANDGGVDRDFRVESDTVSHMLFVDAGSNHVNIGTSTDLGALLNVGGNLAINGGDLNLLGNSGSGTDTKSVQIGHNRTGNGFSLLDFVSDTTYSDYGLRILRGNTGANAKSEITHRGTGKFIINASEGGNEIVLNDGSYDTDFRVESNTDTHMLFVDASEDCVGINESAPDHTLSVNGIIQAKNNSTISLAPSASGTIITPPRGYSYINVSRTDTTAYGLLLLVFRTSTTLVIVSTVDDRSASNYSASVSGTGLVITNDDSSTKNFYASCVCIAFGAGD